MWYRLKIFWSQAKEIKFVKIFVIFALFSSYNKTN